MPPRPAPPSLPAAIPSSDPRGRDEFSGAVDVLKLRGLRAARDHFARVGRGDDALAIADALPSLRGTSFELRRGRAMELAPLLRAPLPNDLDAQLPVIDRDRARRAFGGLRNAPRASSLAEEDLGMRCAVAEDAARRAARAAAATAAAEPAAAATTEAPADAENHDRERRRREKRERKEKKTDRKDRKRARRAAAEGGGGGPADSGLTGISGLTGVTRETTTGSDGDGDGPGESGVTALASG